MATTDMVMLRAENNTQGDDNGGFPINTQVDEATFFDKVFSAEDATAFEKQHKGIWWYKAASGSALYFDPQLWNNPAYDKGAHYVDFIVSDLRETWADVFADLTNRRRYGVGVLTQAASAGAQSITLRVKNPAQATGSDKIFYADGATLTDNLIIDGRSLPGSLDPAQFERIECDDVTSTVDDTTTYSWTTTIVTLHLATPLANSYAVGAKVQTTPDQVDLIPSVDNVVKTGLNSTTFDETALTHAAGNLYNAGTWEMNLKFTMQGTTGLYTVEDTVKYGAIGGNFDKTVTNSFTWPALGTSSPQITIPANTIGGTHADGDFVTLQTHMAGRALFFRLHHPANAGTKLDTVNATGKWEE